jgi:death-on-curing protein
MHPDFLSLENVLEQHTLMIDSYGGSHGVRDLNGLDSALNMPKATFGGEFFIVPTLCVNAIKLIKNYAQYNRLQSNNR